MPTAREIADERLARGEITSAEHSLIVSALVNEKPSDSKLNDLISDSPSSYLVAAIIATIVAYFTFNKGGFLNIVGYGAAILALGMSFATVYYGLGGKRPKSANE